MPAGNGNWDDLILRGDALPALSTHDLLSETAHDYGFDASAALREMRDEER